MTNTTETTNAWVCPICKAVRKPAKEPGAIATQSPEAPCIICGHTLVWGSITAAGEIVDMDYP